MDHPAAPTAVVLCAGGSTRMGTPKGLLPLSGRSLLRAHIDALSTRSSRVVVALGHRADDHRSEVPGHVRIVVNSAWATTWPADTLRLALVQADIRGACWVTPVDVPPADPATLDAILAAGAPAVPTWGGDNPGHPVLLDDRLVAEIRERPPDGGLRTLLGGVTRVPVVQEISVDFDDPEGWARWLRRREGPGGQGPPSG